MVLGGNTLMFKLALLCSFFFVAIFCDAHEVNSINKTKPLHWTRYLEKCQIPIDGKLVKLPFTSPCHQAVHKNDSPNIVEHEGRRISIVIGTTNDFKYLQEGWGFKEEDKCSLDSVGISLDENGAPIEVSIPTSGGMLCPHYDMDAKWFWSYEWPTKPQK